MPAPAPVAPPSSLRPERKFIRYQPAQDDPEVALQHADDAEAEREALQREYLNSQGRAEFYEANSPDRTPESGWRKVGRTILSPVEGGPSIAIDETVGDHLGNARIIPNFSIADLMRPKV